MIKVLWCRFQQSLGAFNMLLVKASTETGLLRHLYDYSFRVPNIGNTKSMMVILFSKIFKNSARFQKCSKKSGKRFFLWDNCIWIGIVKLSLLRTGYFSSAADVLTSSTMVRWAWVTYLLEKKWRIADYHLSGLK